MMIADIRRRLYPGQFSFECAVVVESFSARVDSLFAIQDDVRHDREPTRDEPTDGSAAGRLVDWERVVSRPLRRHRDGRCRQDRASPHCPP